jgi:uncharacterized protein YndB with AHSA1/START domain
LLLIWGGNAMRMIVAAVAAAAGLAAAPAWADVTSSSSSGFIIEAEAEVAAAPQRVWRALTQVGRWWSGAHTYSGEARRMQLDVRAGGCWCERWSGGQVEHGRVLMVMQRDEVRTLRIDTALGPLQALAVNGVLTFAVAEHAGGAKITMSYRASGEPGLELGRMAPLVDMVLMEQFGRLSRYSSSGSPE